MKVAVGILVRIVIYVSHPEIQSGLIGSGDQEIVEVKGNLFEMDVTIKSVNPNENILTSILQTLKANVNPNELPM